LNTYIIKYGRFIAKVLKEKNGKIIDEIRDCGHMLEARDQGGKLVGSYDKKLNIARDKTGKPLETEIYLKHYFTNH